jgi:hypothetical protein
MSKYKYIKEDLEKIIMSSKSIAEVCRKMNIKAVGGNYKTLWSKILGWNIDYSHFTGQGWNVGLKHKPSQPKPIEKILKKNSDFQSFKLKNRLIKEGIKIHICENCLNTEWLNNKIPLELHHVNGDKFDNRLENLQLLCPNCHALTKNYRGKNRVAQRVISEVESVKFGEGLTANTEPS